MKTLRLLSIAGLMAVLGLFSVFPAHAQMTKSAQSDCEHEASRRGFNVVNTSNYKQYRDGWSMNMTVRDNAGRQQSGTCYVDNRTREANLYGFGWGNTGSGTNTFEFNCASIDAKYQECQLPVDGRAQLIKRWSEARCDEGRNWGQRGDRVWVNNGCRARFSVTRSLNNSGSNIDQRRVELACRNQAQREGMDVNRVSAARPENNNWVAALTGTRRNQQVNATCRYYPQRNYAEINMGNGWNSGTGGGGFNQGAGMNTAAAAETACMNEVRRQGYRATQSNQAQSTGNGYGVRMRVQRGPQAPELNAVCRYSNGRANVEIAGPVASPR